MLQAFITSVGLVVLGEIGDKTQLLALMLAVRFHKPVEIALGVLAATVVNHLLAGLAGNFVAQMIDPHVLRWIVGLSFVAMGLWMLVPDKADDDARIAKAQHLGVFVTTFITFFLAEMGDKTQLATVALAARFDSLLAVVAGTTAGMMIADLPAIWLGDVAAKKLPMRLIHIVSAAIFVLLGVATILFPD